MVKRGHNIEQGIKKTIPHLAPQSLWWRMVGLCRVLSTNRQGNVKQSHVQVSNLLMHLMKQTAKKSDEILFIWNYDTVLLLTSGHLCIWHQESRQKNSIVRRPMWTCWVHRRHLHRGNPIVICLKASDGGVILCDLSYSSTFLIRHCQFLWAILSFQCDSSHPWCIGAIVERKVVEKTAVWYLNRLFLYVSLLS